MNLNEIFLLRVNLRDENLTKATWLIRLRWVTILFESVGIFGLAMLHLISMQHYPYFLLMIIALIVFNTASTIFIKDRATIGLKFLITQISFDLLQVFSFLVLISLNKNPLIEILYLYLVLVVFVLPLIWNAFFFFLILLSSGYFYLGAHGDHHNIEHFYSHLFTMLLLWGVLNWLISILNKYQDTLKQVQDNKNRMDRLKSIGAMSSGICHELATPLNTIKLKLNRIQRKKEFLPEDITTSLEAINQCEQSIKKLAKSVVDIESPIEADISLDATMNEIIKQYPEVKFIVKLHTDKNIKANTVLFYQTLFDLIDNAIEASLDKVIKIEFSEDSHSLCLEIINRGSIFPKIVLDKLGEPFLTSRENGNGLGLFNAYNFMLASNGNLSIANIKSDEAVVRLRFNK